MHQREQGAFLDIDTMQGLLQRTEQIQRRGKLQDRAGKVGHQQLIITASGKQGIAHGFQQPGITGHCVCIGEDCQIQQAFSARIPGPVLHALLPTRHRAGPLRIGDHYAPRARGITQRQQGPGKALHILITA